jgi:glioma pathogenesis-related protein 2
MAEIGYTNFVLQYWFLIVIIGCGVIIIILFNVCAYCYFSKNKSVDPVKLAEELDELEQEKLAEKRGLRKDSAGFTSPGAIKSAGPIANELPDDGDNDDIEQFRLDALTAHNLYREKHNVGHLQYCESLSIYAQYWAENMAKTSKISHSPSQWREKYNGDPLGENLISTDQFKITGKGLSDMWYSESFKHDFNSETQTDTRSFTQMVWSSTKQVGFGRAKGPDGNWYACAHYAPTGNVPGEFFDNVFPFDPAQHI